VAGAVIRAESSYDDSQPAVIPQKNSIFGFGELRVGAQDSVLENPKSLWDYCSAPLIPIRRMSAGGSAEIDMTCHNCA
jgi:hypothetical protein